MPATDFLLSVRECSLCTVGTSILSICRLKGVIGKEDFLLPNEQYVGFRAN
jgi:hypothetical protein